MKNPQIVIFIFVLVFIFPTYSKAAEDSLKITKEAHILKSKRLSKKYDAYNVTIENLSPVEIGLRAINISGNTIGSDAYQRAKKSAGSTLAGIWTIGVMLWWLLLIPVAAALVMTPIVLIPNNVKNGTARKESIQYNESYKELKSIPAQSKIKFGVLVPKNKNFEVEVLT
jgi:hypothetical protein